MVVSELASYNPDIVCLQEVQPELFNSHLLNPLMAAGFAAAVCPPAPTRPGRPAVGTALLWRRSVLDVVSPPQHIKFGDLASGPPPPPPGTP